MYYLIYSGARKAFYKLFNTRKFDLPCSRNMYISLDYHFLLFFTLWKGLKKHRIQ